MAASDPAKNYDAGADLGIPGSESGPDLWSHTYAAFNGTILQIPPSLGKPYEGDDAHSAWLASLASDYSYDSLDRD